MAGEETTVELDRAEVLKALQFAKNNEDQVNKAENQVTNTEELRKAIKTIKNWAETNDQWLVILAPWGMHHYGKLREDQVEMILKRFAPQD